MLDSFRSPTIVRTQPRLCYWRFMPDPRSHSRSRSRSRSCSCSLHVRSKDVPDQKSRARQLNERMSQTTNNIRRTVHFTAVSGIPMPFTCMNLGYKRTMPLFWPIRAVNASVPPASQLLLKIIHFSHTTVKERKQTMRDFDDSCTKAVKP